MSAQSVTLAGQRAAESRMGAPNGGSTITVRRKAGATTRNPANGTEVPVWAVVAANVPARFASDEAQRQTVTRGGVEVVVTTRRIDIPAAYVSTVRVGDYIDVTDGEWAGTALRIEARKGKTALRMPAEEMDRPDEWG